MSSGHTGVKGDPSKGSFSDLKASEFDCNELRSEWDVRKQRQRMEPIFPEVWL